MTNLNITISYKDTMRRVYTETGYTAQARSNVGLSPELSDSMSATEEDNRILENEFIAAAKDTSSLITRYMTPCDVKFIKDSKNVTDVTQLVFAVPDNFPSEVVSTLEKSIEEFITSHIIQRWVMIMKPDEANIHAIKMQNETIRIREMLAARKKPQ